MEKAKQWAEMDQRSSGIAGVTLGNTPNEGGKGATHKWKQPNRGRKWRDSYLEIPPTEGGNGTTHNWKYPNRGRKWRDPYLKKAQQRAEMVQPIL